jgi:hypothetical protein
MGWMMNQGNCRTLAISFALASLWILTRTGWADAEHPTLDGEGGGLEADLLLEGASEAGTSDLVDATPRRLNDWTFFDRTLNPDAFPALTLGGLPQARRTIQPPFIDFDKLEVGGEAGVVDFSSKFKASASYVLGLDARVPIPGLPLGDWGFFGELYLSYINRNLPFFYPDKSGNWYGLAVGADYTIVSGSIAYLRLRGGIGYAYFNRIQSVDNGFGAEFGAELGFFWIKHNDKASVTLVPEVFYNGTDFIFFTTLGFSVQF